MASVLSPFLRETNKDEKESKWSEFDWIRDTGERFIDNAHPSAAVNSPQRAQPH